MARHHTPALVVAITDSMNEAFVTLEQLPGPFSLIESPTCITAQLCDFYEFSIYYYWVDFNDKSKCIDYGELITTREIEDNLGIDVCIIPTLTENIAITDHCISNRIWAEIARNLRSRIFDYDIQNTWHGSNDGPLTNMYILLKKLEHCFGENVKVSHNHLKQSK